MSTSRTASRGRCSSSATPGALAIVSTPYHEYSKNLALSLVPGAWDRTTIH